MRGVVVVGSANLDLRLRVGELPQAGETVLALDRSHHVGGKGANQAVAAARLGTATAFVGCVGDDEDGRTILRAMQASGVDVRDVELLGGVGTGLAVVVVSETGENSIIVDPGANGRLPSERVARVLRRRGTADTVVVLQAEIPVPTVIEAIRVAHGLDARVIFNAAPFTALPRDVLAQVDYLIVNEVEAGELLGDRTLVGASPSRAVQQVAGLALRGGVITVGGQGAFWADAAGTSGHMPAIDVPVVDTTGAGDAFVGAFSSAIAESATLREAVSLGVRAGSFAVQREGAQRSYPRAGDLAEVGPLG